MRISSQDLSSYEAVEGVRGFRRGFCHDFICAYIFQSHALTCLSFSGKGVRRHLHRATRAFQLKSLQL